MSGRRKMDAEEEGKKVGDDKDDAKKGKFSIRKIRDNSCVLINPIQ